MAATIHFTGGKQVTVQANAGEVLDELDKARRFARFVMVGGLEIHVAGEQVAYVSQVPSDVSEVRGDDPADHFHDAE
jgi:hypothetical protein